MARDRWSVLRCTRITQFRQTFESCLVFQHRLFSIHACFCLGITFSSVCTSEPLCLPVEGCMENDSCRDVLEQGERNEHKNFRGFLFRRVELEERRTPCPRYVQPFARRRSLPTRRQIAALDRFRSSHTLHPLSRHLSFHQSSSGASMNYPLSFVPSRTRVSIAFFEASTSSFFSTRSARLERFLLRFYRSTVHNISNDFSVTWICFFVITVDYRIHIDTSEALEI